MQVYFVVERHNDKVGVSNIHRSRIHAIAEMQEMFNATCKANTEIASWTDVTDKTCTTPHICFVDGKGQRYSISVLTRTIDL